jgi:predicted homoserine dehydrogenase-like protein
MGLFGAALLYGDGIITPAISVLSAALRHEPTGAPRGFRGDVVAIAKRDLQPGDTLDGEGGYTVWGKLLPAALSLSHDALPIGLAHGIRLVRPVAAGSVVRHGDVSGIPPAILTVRRDMERRFAPAG